MHIKDEMATNEIVSPVTGVAGWNMESLALTVGYE
jgi:hypothetical protein